MGWRDFTLQMLLWRTSEARGAGDNVLMISWIGLSWMRTWSKAGSWVLSLHIFSWHAENLHSWKIAAILLLLLFYLIFKNYKRLPNICFRGLTYRGFLCFRSTLHHQWSLKVSLNHNHRIIICIWGLIFILCYSSTTSQACKRCSRWLSLMMMLPSSLFRFQKSHVSCPCFSSSKTSTTA